MKCIGKQLISQAKIQTPANHNLISARHHHHTPRQLIVILLIITCRINNRRPDLHRSSDHGHTNSHCGAGRGADHCGDTAAQRKENEEQRAEAQEPGPPGFMACDS